MVYELVEGRIVCGIGTYEHHGCGPDQERQEQSHGHSLKWLWCEALLSVADLGTDELVQYAWEEKLQSWVEQSRFETASGIRSAVSDA